MKRSQTHHLPIFALLLLAGVAATPLAYSAKHRLELVRLEGAFNAQFYYADTDTLAERLWLAPRQPTAFQVRDASTEDIALLLVAVANHERLRDVTLENCELGGFSNAKPPSLPQVRIVDIVCRERSPKSLAEVIDCFPNAEELLLRNVGSDNDADKIGKMHRLQRLNCESGHITGRSLGSLLNLPNFYELSLIDCPVDAAGIELGISLACQKGCWVDIKSNAESKQIAELPEPCLGVLSISTPSWYLEKLDQTVYAQEE